MARYGDPEMYNEARAAQLDKLQDLANRLKAAIQAAIQAAVLAEREACARIAEQEAAKHGIRADASFGSEGYGWNRGAAAIAAAIRARGQSPDVSRQPEESEV